MIQQKLVELYFEKAPSSSYSYVEIEEEIVWLLNKGIKPEELYFYIQYLSRYYPVELAHEFAEAIVLREDTLKSNYDLAKARQSLEKRKEGEKLDDYNPRNTLKRKDTPQWLGKSFDKHLFK